MLSEAQSIIGQTVKTGTEIVTDGIRVMVTNEAQWALQLYSLARTSSVLGHCVLVSRHIVVSDDFGLC